MKKDSFDLKELNLTALDIAALKDLQKEFPPEPEKREEYPHLYHYSPMGAMAGYCVRASEWSEITQEALLKWKDIPCDRVTAALADLILSRLPNRCGFYCITTAPMKMERVGSYHPSATVAKKVAKSLGARFIRCFAKRIIHRQKGPRGRNNCPGPVLISKFRGKWVLLVDDVTCSGATAKTCAKSLRDAGNSVETIAAVFWDKAVK